jgi:4-amino-4-deoxy-L-arabinose transferase-like glycosyltransferase
MAIASALQQPDARSPTRLWSKFDRWTAGMKGPLFAAALVLVTAGPGLFALPPLDRDEARFAEASAQMLETGDPIDIRYQNEARDKKPVGIHWLQSASVSLLSSVDKRQIWAYRIPSLLGAMLAAAACAWGAAAFFGPRAGTLAGAMLGASVLLSTEAAIAKTDSVLCGAVTLSMAALARLYGAARGEGMIRPDGGTKALFWSGLAASILVKGPVGPMVAALTITALAIADRRLDWIRSLGWGWGVTLVLLVIGPWSAAITVATDGSFWTHALGGDVAAKLDGVREMHGAPPGAYACLTPLLFFPSSFLLPAAMLAGWRGRGRSGVRFALAWLIPTWLVFEAAPTKLIHYTLPTYGALAWLAAAALDDPARVFGPRSRWIGAALSLAAGMVGAALTLGAVLHYGDPTGLGWAIAGAGLFAAAGLAGAWALWRGRFSTGLLASVGLGVLAHIVLSGGLAPRLVALWPSERVADRLAKDGLDPRNGVTTGPVAVVGYAEPSLVFALGTATELDTPADGADSVSDGQPAIVEGRADKAFRAALSAQKVPARPVDEVKGFDYSTGKPVDLTIWRSLAPPRDGATFDATGGRQASAVSP